MTENEMSIANLASDIVQFVLQKPGDAQIRVAALQVAQHIIGQANAIVEANKAAKNTSAKQPGVSGAFL